MKHIFSILEAIAWMITVVFAALIFAFTDIVLSVLNAFKIEKWGKSKIDK